MWIGMEADVLSLLVGASLVSLVSKDLLLLPSYMYNHAVFSWSTTYYVSPLQILLPSHPHCMVVIYFEVECNLSGSHVEIFIYTSLMWAPFPPRI